MTANLQSQCEIHPSFESFHQVIPMSGFSGAAIALLRNPGSAAFVRKAAASPERNAPLRAQALRQRWLRDQLAGAAAVPEVFNENEVDGLYFFDMEFVPSRDANSFLATASFGDTEDFAASIERLLRELSDRRLEGQGSFKTTPLLEKIDEINSRTRGLHSAILYPLRDLIVTRGTDFLGGAATACHGDLTFENVLVGGNRQLWLIDAIPAPINHYWFDWTKLFQECEGQWYLHRGKPISVGVTHWLRNRWHKAASAIDPRYARWHYVLLALTFARILPYARTPDDVNFVTARVQRFRLSAENSS